MAVLTLKPLDEFSPTFHYLNQVGIHLSFLPLPDSLIPSTTSMNSFHIV